MDTERRVIDCFKFKGTIYIKYADKTCLVYKKVGGHDTASSLLTEIFDETKKHMIM